MILNKLRYILVIIPLLWILGAKAQNFEKIEKRLNTTYQKGQYEKLVKQASKVKKKYPRSELPYYYLAKAEIIKFNRTTNLPNKKQYNYLRKASNYSRKLGSDYTFWQDSLNFYYEQYISSWNDHNYESEHIKKVINAYTKTHKDKLNSYFSYSGSPIALPEQTIHELPKTGKLRTQLITVASEQLGAKYHYGGERPEDGFDCSGFVKYVYNSIGVELPHNSHLMSQVEGEIIALEDAEPGDLIFFGTGNTKRWKTQHAGIIYEYTPGEPKIIHCPSRGVIIDGNNSSWNHYWEERVLFVKRLPQLEE